MSSNAWVIMAILLGFKIFVLILMTCLLFSSIRNREKVLDLNEEIVRKNEISSPPNSKVNPITGDEEYPDRGRGDSEIFVEEDEEEEVEFYDQSYRANLGLRLK